MARKRSLIGDRYVRVRAFSELPPDEQVELPATQQKKILMPELIGFVMARWRKRGGLYQEEMAEKLDWAQSLISNLERGAVTISVEQLHKMVVVINEGLIESGIERIRPWDVLEDAYRIARLVREEGYPILWCTGPACDQPAFRGRALVRWLKELDNEG